MCYFSFLCKHVYLRKVKAVVAYRNKNRSRNKRNSMIIEITCFDYIINLVFSKVINLIFK